MAYPDDAMLDLPGGPHARPVDPHLIAAEDRAAAGRLLFTATDALAIECDRVWDDQTCGTADDIDVLAAQVRWLHSRLLRVLGPA